jgi:large subunit ribosomal protein L24
MRKIRKGDDVIVLAGKDKGRRGAVVSVVNAGERVIVNGVQIVKKHVKPRQLPTGEMSQGGIEEREASIHVSNVALFNSETNKADRVGFREENGVKVRFFKSTGKAV